MKNEQIEKFLKEELDNDFTNEHLNPVGFEVKIDAHKLIELLSKFKNNVVLDGVVCCKITAMVTYSEIVDSGHPMLDDTKATKSKIVEVSNLTEINNLFKNLIDVKILK